jgi:hypothetical protein
MLEIVVAADTRWNLAALALDRSWSAPFPMQKATFLGLLSDS